MLQFAFELRPVLQVPPWGSDRPNLHWFGLTDGWYWINAQDCELLRYRDNAVRRWELERPYPGYYVARLWEDVLALRWALQEPVPQDLVAFVDGTFPRRDFPDDDQFGAGVDAAFGFQGDHHLDLGYLTGSPILRCWRQSVEGRDVVTLSQQISPEKQGTFAGPERLDVALPAAGFFAAVEDFDRRLIEAMEQRVAELECTGPPPGVALDVQQLRLEHVQRSRWLAQRLTAPRQIDWTAVRAGVAEISSWPLLQQGEGD
ncbi:DUF5984 family protein [Micromonospora coxensis]|uniref:DUF5984 family protein n=1 Tax=Micromonospora coxensis TaxID=356852 RepID=UPI00342D1720